MVARQHRPGTPASLNIERQQLIADHRAYVQSFVEQGMDVYGAIAVAENLQNVFHVLQLLGNDRLKQLFLNIDPEITSPETCG
ncbi:hypothetical protein ACFS4T_15985 [Pseudomonas lini]